MGAAAIMTDVQDNDWGCHGSCGLGNLFGVVYVTRAELRWIRMCTVKVNQITAIWFTLTGLIAGHTIIMSFNAMYAIYSLVYVTQVELLWIIFVH